MIGLCAMGSLRVVLIAIPWSVIGNALVVLVVVAILCACPSRKTHSTKSTRARSKKTRRPPGRECWDALAARAWQASNPPHSRAVGRSTRKLWASFPYGAG